MVIRVIPANKDFITGIWELDLTNEKRFKKKEGEISPLF
jgi:hypothetical protein